MKKIISLNAILTFINLLMMFCLRVYVSRKFPKEDLIVYYTLFDALAWMIILFTGFKDALVRVFNNAEDKIIIVREMLIGFMAMWGVLSIFVVPYLHYIYLTDVLINYDISFIKVETLFFLMIFNFALTYIMLANRVYQVLSLLEFVKGFLFVIFFCLLLFFLSSASGHQYLINSILLANLFLLLWQFWSINKYIPSFSLLKVMKVQRRSNRQDKKNFYIYSLLSTFEYSSGSVYIYISSFVILSIYKPDQLADFQIVARPIYLALIAVFSYPIFRFMFPEFSLMVTKINMDKVKNIKKRFVKLCVLFGILIVSGCWLLSAWVLGIFFPPEYIKAAHMLNVLVIGLPFVVYTSYAFAWIKATGGFKYTLSIRLTGMSSFFIFLYLFHGLEVGVSSVIYAMLASVLIMFVGALWVEKKFLSEYFQQKQEISDTVAVLAKSN